ncbi:hypothetical protein DPMN_026260 [Dreissena polymorpha]|uniref:Uncharacterized protein n=1 Tax=Dreissena polymorpha TaxID=45954 RepID=A0A9D4RCK5_DREPO|nr:hypothetical protein DPMN_026260 [Dreissena polymorpha]
MTASFHPQKKRNNIDIIHCYDTKNNSQEDEKNNLYNRWPTIIQNRQSGLS